MSIPKIGSAPSQQVSTPSNSVQGGSKPQGTQGGSKLQGLEQYQGAVDDLAQHLAADSSLRTPGQLREQAQGALSGLGLKGGALQELVRQTLDKVNEIRMSSGDRWLRSPTTGNPGDIFTLGSGSLGGRGGGGPTLV